MFVCPKEYLLPEHIFFTLITMEIEGFPAPVLRLVHSIGCAIFGDNCVSPSLYHMTGIPRNKVLTIPCEELKSTYPGLIIIIIMVIFKCYFSGEHIALSIKK